MGEPTCEAGIMLGTGKEHGIGRNQILELKFYLEVGRNSITDTGKKLCRTWEAVKHKKNL